MILVVALTGGCQTNRLPAEPEEPVVHRARAEAVERVPPRYPRRAVQKGGEGRVLLSFVIQADGTTRDVVVIASTGSRSFEPVAIRAVLQWKYLPAVRNGVPIETANMRIIIPFRIGRQMGTGEKGLGASADFIQADRAIHQLISNQEYDRALGVIEPLLRSDGLNMYEAARLNLARAIIYEATDREDDLYGVLSLMTLGNGQDVEDRYYRAALATMAKISLKKDRYARAADDLRTLSSISADDLPEEMQRLAEEIERIRLDETPYSVDAVLSAAASTTPEGSVETIGTWSYKPLRATVAIAGPVDGEIDAYSLRCPAYVEDGEVELDREIEMLPEWGACRIRISGEPGATFSLVEGSRASATTTRDSIPTRGE